MPVEGINSFFGQLPLHNEKDIFFHSLNKTDKADKVDKCPTSISSIMPSYGKIVI
jgi:hypothetical protein